MDIFVYADESGTFDYIHNEIFVFGGVIYLSKENKDIATRKYLKVERDIRNSKSIENEIKACKISNGTKNKIFRSLNNTLKFSAIINQKRINKNIYKHKKSKQRYLDYAFKIAVKKFLESLIKDNIINPLEVENIYVYMDEHTTATDGRYELRESLEQEFKIGTYNYTYSKFYEPIFINLKNINLSYCNSEKVPLVRASDIVANKVYYCAKNSKLHTIEDKVYIKSLP